MFAVPELYRTRDFLNLAEDVHVQLCKHECVFWLACDLDANEICNIIMAETHRSLPSVPYQAVNLYMNLREAVHASL